MRIALTLKSWWRVRSALLAGDLTHARKLFRFSLNAFGRAATAAVLGSGYLAGRGEWMRRHDQESKDARLALIAVAGPIS